MLPTNRVLITISGTGYCVYFDNTASLKECNHLQLFEKLFLKQANSSNDNKQKIAPNFFSGANVLEKGQLDIWINRKRKKIIQLSEINASSALFPILNSDCKIHKNKNNQLLLAQQEKGLVTKLVLPCSQFLIDNLLLHIIHIKTEKTELKLIRQITYNGKQLITLKNDTLVTGSIIDKQHE